MAHGIVNRHKYTQNLHSAITSFPPLNWKGLFPLKCGVATIPKAKFHKTKSKSHKKTTKVKKNSQMCSC
jgi:hypothetical protein